jgi:PAS domain S-box-containing protein
MENKLDKDELRKLAKKRLESRSLGGSPERKESLELAEELGIHQEELEIQNEELRRTQLELEESRSKYFELYDLAPVGYVTLTKDLIIKESNLAASAILGTDRAALINKGLSSFVSPRSQDLLYLHYKRLDQGHEKQIHKLFTRRKEGSDILVQFESNIVEGEYGLGFRSILTDITERAKQEKFTQSLNQINTQISSSFNFEDIMDHVVIGASRAMNGAGTSIFMRDGSGWTIRYEHNLPLRLVTVPMGEKIAKLSDLTAERREVVTIRDAQNDPITKNISSQRYGLKSALTAPLISGGEVIGILSFTYFDRIKDFEQMEIDFARKLASSISLAIGNARLYENLSASEAKYRGMFENLREGVSLRRIILDANGNAVDMEVIDVNPAALKGMGNRSADEVKGRKISEILNPKMTAKALEMAREMATTGKPIFEVMEIDSNNRYFLTAYVPVTGDNMIVTSIDVTEQKQLEEELKRSNTDLQQFAYVASHDLKEPLRMVASYLQLLERINKKQWNDESKEYMRFAVEGAFRMRSMIDDLLAYARVASKGSPFTIVEMDEVLATVLNDLRVGIKESGAFINSEPLPSITADKSQMVILLENLVGNAVKYREKTAPQIQIKAKKEGKVWVFSIQDNGIGIDPEYQDRIFQIFQRLHTQEEYSGTGMGLAIAKRIVERHGGRIWFESEEGKGATFFFTVPRETPSEFIP